MDLHDGKVLNILGVGAGFGELAGFHLVHTALRDFGLEGFVVV